MFNLLLAAAAAASFTWPDIAGDPSYWVTSDDYPSEARHNGERGQVGFSIIVGADGKPTSCQITSSSGYPDLDTKTCILMMVRSRFKPAVTETGQPLISTYRNYVHWEYDASHSGDDAPMGDLILSVASLPAGSEKRPLVHAYVLVDAHGTPSNCYVKPDKKVAGLEGISCREALTQWHFDPLVDRDGTKVMSVQSVLVAYDVARARPETVSDRP